MSDELRLFASAVASVNDAGEISVVSRTWSTTDAVMADAVVEAMRSLLGEPYLEKLFDDTGARALSEAQENAGVVILRTGDDS